MTETKQFDLIFLIETSLSKIARCTKACDQVASISVRIAYKDAIIPDTRNRQRSVENSPIVFDNYSM